MRGDRGRALVALVVTIVGLLAVPLVVPFPTWTAVPWLVVGFAAGVSAGRLSAVWTVWLGSVVAVPLLILTGLVPLTGKLLIFGIGVSILFVAALATIGFVAGSVLITRGRAVSRLKADWGGLSRSRRRMTALALLAALTAMVVYTGYVGAAGADDWARTGTNKDCRTPAFFGWPYEAINYDIADDANLHWRQETDQSGNLTWVCDSQGAPAGTDVVTSDGAPIGGWYIPTASADPTGPTVIVIPGANSNKSGMLDYADKLRASFNLVLLDSRGNGRSVPATRTLGLREYLDVVAMIDWLERVKHPVAIGALGDSLGAQTALAAAAKDQRIQALVLDSMHASSVTAAGRIMETEFGLPALPGAIAVIGITSMRIGGDIAAMDPLATISGLHGQHVLLIHGTSDVIDVPGLSVDLVAAGARAAGVDVEVQFCSGGSHGRLVDNPDCTQNWTTWVNDFFAASLAG